LFRCGKQAIRHSRYRRCSQFPLLALLIGGPAITHDDASPPSGGGWGGSFNPYETAGDPSGLVDLAYVFGRWVYDSLHKGAESNELHPVHYMIKIGQATQGDLSVGLWPPDLGTVQQRYDAQFGVINSPGTIDADYRGEISVILINHGEAPFAIHRGERIAQMVIAPVVQPELVVATALSKTDRGSGGFGSTGR